MKKSRPAFYSLVLWQRAQSLASTIASLVDELPRRRSAYALGNQILRSAASVPANIAEGYGRYSEPAYRNHLSIARGSLFETESTIDLLARAGFVPPEVAEQLIGECEEVARLVTATMKPLRNARRAAVREEGPGYSD